MAAWIKSLRQQDGSFVIVIPREVYGTDGKAAIIEDFATRASPLEFANAILRAHGVEPAHVFAGYGRDDALKDAALALYQAGLWGCHTLSSVNQARLWVALRDALNLPAGTATAAGVAAEPHPNTLPDPAYVHHDAVMAQHEGPIARALDPEQDDDEGAPGEPPRCKTGGCEG